MQKLKLCVALAAVAAISIGCASSQKQAKLPGRKTSPVATNSRVVGPTNTSKVANNVAAEPELIVKINGVEKKFGRDELLHSPLAQKLVVENDPTYQKKMEYIAVPAALIFGGIDPQSDTTLVFSCADGFSAPISAERVLNMNPLTSSAFVAIEDPNSPWPEIKKGNTGKSAGPFYLVWQNPTAAKISAEEWPYQLASFEIKPSVEKQFPHIVPDSKLGKNSSVRKGYELFLKNCFTCHTMNKEGLAQMGPDLNVPMNPTEYLKNGMIEKLVRNPQSLRHWPKSQMSSFTIENLSDSDLKNIIDYLKHMAKRKAS